MANKTLTETCLVLEFCDKGNLQVGRKKSFLHSFSTGARSCHTRSIVVMLMHNGLDTAT